MILHSSRPAPRGGFTLLEILLAALLATLVLAAVYTLMSVTLTQTQASRDAVEVEDLSRGIFNRFSSDLSGTLVPLPPKSGGNSAASNGGTGSPSSSGTPSTDGSATPTTPAAPTTGATAPTDGSADPSATDNGTAFAASYGFQAGVIGDEKKLVIYAGRTPEAFSRQGNPGDQVRSDQRQIIYWLGKSNNGGLYRRERPWVTADDVRGAIDDDEEAADSVLLAEEVADVTFEYSDGSTWATTWDGTAAGSDGVTPLGPPRAIRITLTLKIPVTRGEPVTKVVSQVIAIRSAPGTYTPPLLESTPDSPDSTTPTDPSKSGTTPGTTGGMTPSGTTGGTKTGSNPGGTNTGGAKMPGGTTPGGNNSGGNKMPGGSTPGGSNPGGTSPGGNKMPGGTSPGGRGGK